MNGVYGNPPWIDGQWRVRVDSKLESDGIVSRIYSVKSVSFEIPLQYLTYCYSTFPWLPLTENYLLVLDSSDFDLSFDYTQAASYNCSFVLEGGVGMPDYYQYQIFLRRGGQTVVITPKDSTFTIGGGNEGQRGGFLIASHPCESADCNNPAWGWGAWPDGSSFVPPPNCSWLRLWDPPGHRVPLVEEIAALYKTVRFLDEEDETRPVFGAVADGSSRVIVELHGVQSSADVTIPAGDGDGTWVSDPTLQSGVWRRTWQAPESFSGSDDDNIQGRRPISFAIVADGQSIDPPTFDLYKAPVVLLHGIWSNASIWSLLQDALRQNGFLFTHAESYPNQASFFDNRLVTSKHVEQALAQVQGLGLVAKKADVVAHSMGGCLAKLNGSSEYIRRIVTIGTPHFGSEVADVFYYHPWGEALLNSIGRTKNGAIYDLTTNRCIKYGITGNRLGVPVLAINGIVEPNNRLPMFSLSNGYLTILKILLDEWDPSSLHYDLFGFDTSDWVVSGTSQTGGLTDSVQNVDVTWHLDEPFNSVVISDTIAFLDAPSDMVSAVLNSQAAMLAEPQGAAFQPTVRPMVSVASGAGTITITAPAAGRVFSPGDTMHVAVSTPPTATRVLVALSDGPVVVDNTSPFEMDIPIPQQALGTIPIGVVAWDASGVIGTASRTVTVTTAATVTALKVWPDSVLYLNAGETVPFVVHGIFSDGIERDITASECGTAYNTTDSSVASIDANGVLTARAPGYCSVIVSNGDSMQIPVLVQTTTLAGDLNDDGKVDFDDFAIFADQWLLEKLSADVAPGRGDGIVNFIDFAVFANGWQGNMNELADFVSQWLKPSAYCADIAPLPPDGIVNFLDFAVLAEHWLAGVTP
jgi:hypothetical protein